MTRVCMFTFLLVVLLAWDGVLSVVLSNKMVKGENDKPGFIKAGLGYKGNLMVFQANASVSYPSHTSNNCSVMFRSGVGNVHGMDRIGHVKWNCDDGQDLVIGTYFGTGTYQGQHYRATIFYTPLWIPLLDTFDGPIRFRLKDVKATLHLYVSRFSNISWDQPLILQIDQDITCLTWKKVITPCPSIPFQVFP